MEPRCHRLPLLHLVYRVPFWAGLLASKPGRFGEVGDFFFQVFLNSSSSGFLAYIGAWHPRLCGCRFRCHLRYQLIGAQASHAPTSTNVRKEHTQTELQLYCHSWIIRMLSSWFLIPTCFRRLCPLSCEWMPHGNSQLYFAICKDTLLSFSCRCNSC